MPQTYKQERWDTSQLLPAITSKHYQTYYQELETWVEQFITNKQQLTSTITPEELLQILQQLEKIEERSSILGNYSYLWYSEDTNNQQARAYKEKITKQLTELGNKLLYFTLWIKNLDEKNAQRIIKALPTDYQYFLEEIRIRKPYTLEEREEQIINYKDNTGTTALNQLYDMITSNFTYTLTINNKKKTLTREELSNYIRSTNPTIRKQAYDVLAKKYEEHQDVLGEIYKNIVNDWETESITIRKHPHSMHPRHLGNHIDEEAITTMLNVIRTNNETFQNYFKLKAKMIGMKKLRRYDLYAPIKRKEKNYQWNEAVHLVLDSYQQFSPTMAAHAKKILDEHHVDSLINKGKMTGAYCMDLIPGITPYVLINYTGKTRDVTTLAHELGHGVHDLLTHKHNGFVSHPPLILAETASIFGEMIITEKLLEQATPEEQTTIIADKLDDLYASIPRQAYFVIYEQEAHKKIHEGTTIEQLNTTYLKNLKEQFGNSIELPKQFQHEWLSIPHIYHTPYYCYAYSFGNLLTLALYQRYKEEGQPFVKDYLQFLSHGGSKKPAAIAEELNIDFNNKQFWKAGYEQIQQLVEQLKTSVRQL